MEEENKKINFTDLVNLSRALEKKRLYFKARRKDDFTAYLEPMGICACDGKIDKAVEEVEKYFRGKNFKVNFDYERFEFRII